MLTYKTPSRNWMTLLMHMKLSSIITVIKKLFLLSMIIASSTFTTLELIILLLIFPQKYYSHLHLCNFQIYLAKHLVEHLLPKSKCFCFLRWSKWVIEGLLEKKCRQIYKCARWCDCKFLLHDTTTLAHLSLYKILIFQHKLRIPEKTNKVTTLVYSPTSMCFQKWWTTKANMVP